MTSIRLNRTDPPFFNRSSVKRAIQDIATVDGLVIYAGSGVSIDDTGASWTSMLVHMAQKTALDPEKLARFQATLSAPQIASIVYAALEDRYEHGARSELAKSLSSAFYAAHAWRNSQFSRTVALLCDQYAADNKSVTILTTNYDTYLEDNSKFLRGEGVINHVNLVIQPAPVGSDDEGDDEDSRPDVSQVQVVHLHGFVQQGDHQEKVDQIVFTEADYFTSEEKVFRFIESAFTDHDVLILGSALDDAPVVRALTMTKSIAAEHGRRRWAVVPRQSFAPEVGAFDCIEEGSPNDVLKLLGKRAEQLGVTMLMPDFFSQAAQLPREIGRAVNLLAAGDHYETASGDYQTRLNSWWTRWLENEGEAAHQAASHEVLRESVGTVQILLDNVDENVKLELWVREKDQRNLSLWASSTGTWPDRVTARQAPIEHDSKYAASTIFCSGTSQLIATSDSSDRWDAYFGTPVRVGEGVDSVTVGVITVAVGKRQGVTKPSALQHPEPKVLARLVTDLISIGLKLVTLDQ